MPYCKVECCRFPDSHTTRGHKCGYCGGYGHGQIECGNQERIDKLAPHLEETLPKRLWCTHCPSSSVFVKKTHTNMAHNCRKCGRRHGEEGCIIQDISVFKERFQFIDEVSRFSTSALQDSPLDNIYSIIYSGMGSKIYIIKKDGVISSLFMHQDSWGQYGPLSDDTPILNKFIDGLEYCDSSQFSSEDSTGKIYTCPICRTDNQSSKIVKAFGLEEKCKICLENSVERFFTECGHAVACESCFKQM